MHHFDMRMSPEEVVVNYQKMIKFRHLIQELLEGMYDELPEKKPKKAK